MDELFGRSNFIPNVVWQKRTSPDFRAVLGDGHENILIFSRHSLLFRETANLLPLSDRQQKEYKNLDNDPRGRWVSRDFSAQGYRPNQMYKITTPSGSEYYPPEGSCWKNAESVFLKQVQEGRFWFGKDGKGVPRRKNYLSEAIGRQSWTWWPNEEVGNTQEAKRGSNRTVWKIRCLRHSKTRTPPSTYPPHRHQPRRSRPRLLPRIRHDGCGGA